MNSKRKPQRSSIGPDHDKTWITVKEYAVDLGSAARGNRRYKVLKHLLRDVITLNRQRLEFQDMCTIRDWMRTSRFRIALQSPFIVYLEPDEYAAVSRGLRALGTSPANTMYQWFGKNRSATHEDACPCAACALVRHE